MDNRRKETTGSRQGSRGEVMFYVQIFNNFGEKKPLTMRYGPSTGNTWEQVMSYAQFFHAMYNIRVFVRIFDEAEINKKQGDK